MGVALYVLNKVQGTVPFWVVTPPVPGRLLLESYEAFFSRGPLAISVPSKGQIALKVEGGLSICASQYLPGPGQYSSLISQPPSCHSKWKEGREAGHGQKRDNPGKAGSHEAEEGIEGSVGLFPRSVVGERSRRKENTSAELLRLR